VVVVGLRGVVVPDPRVGLEHAVLRAEAAELAVQLLDDGRILIALLLLVQLAGVSLEDVERDPHRALLERLEESRDVRPELRDRCEPIARQLLLELVLEIIGGVDLRAGRLCDPLRPRDLRDGLADLRCDVALVQLVDLLEPDQLVLSRRAFAVLLSALDELGAIDIDRGLEAGEVCGDLGDLARVVRCHPGRQRLDLLRDAEQLIVVGRRERSALDTGAEHGLHLVGQVREVLVLEQRLVADRIPQLAIAGLA
jgi:hypothetical protein